MARAVIRPVAWEMYGKPMMVSVPPATYLPQDRERPTWRVPERLSHRRARAVIRRHDPHRALLLDWLDPIPTACRRDVCDGCQLCALLDARAGLAAAMD